MRAAGVSPASEARFAQRHLPVGEGTIDFRALAVRYIETEWAFPVAVECKRLEDVLASVEALRHLFAEAGKYDPL